MINSYKKGDTIRIAQDTQLCTYSKNEKTLYYAETTSKSTIGIYLRKFSEYNDHLCEVIVGDKIVYIPQKDIRDLNFKYHGKDL